MAKLTLDDVTNITGNPTSAENTINNNSNRIETAVENTLSRDGTSPNQMNAVIDMNSNRIINLADAVDLSDAVTLRQASVLAGGGDIIVAAELDDLDDVIITAPQEDEVLIFDGTYWRNEIRDSVGIPQTALELAQGVTPVDTSYQQFDVRRYGAKPDTELDADPATNVLAFQTAFNLAQANLGGRVTMGYGRVYEINATVKMGTLTTLEGGRGSLVVTTNNIPAIQLGISAYTNGVCIKDLWIEYINQQPVANTSGYGIQIGNTGLVVWNVKLERVNVKYAAGAVKLPELVGCTAFLVKMEHVTADQYSDRPMDIRGDVSGARTNIEASHCWGLQASGDEISTAKGFRFARCHGLRLNHCGVDHMQSSDAFLIESCQGDIGTLWAESCDWAVTSGPTAAFNFSDSLFNVHTLYTDGNNVNLTLTGEFYGIRVQGNSKVSVGTFMDLNTTVTGTQASKYFSATADSTSKLSVDRYLATGATPAQAFVDTAVPPNIHYWNGQSRESGVITLTLVGVTPTVNTNVVYTKEGNLVHLKFNNTSSTYNTGENILLSGLPAGLHPDRYHAIFNQVLNNNGTYLGVIEIGTNGVINLIPYDLTSNKLVAAVKTGTVGIPNTTLTYSLV